MSMTFRSDMCEIVYMQDVEDGEQQQTVMEEKITEWLSMMGSAIVYHHSISGANMFWVGSTDKESNTNGYYIACKVECRDDVVQVVKVLCLKDYEFFIEIFGQFKKIDGC